MNQLCKVCGEPAAGFHFGAFTCEGCKSFFGRTYNNISSISECKNNGECVINKKNRTACKACRLRKCLLVGMSKSGSRYGRRSNWFKIHCLLQEQQQQQQQQQHHHHHHQQQQQQAGTANSLAAAAVNLLRPHPYLTPLFRATSTTTATTTIQTPSIKIPSTISHTRDTRSSESDSGASSADLEDDLRSTSAFSYLKRSMSPASDRCDFYGNTSVNNNNNNTNNNNNNTTIKKLPSPVSDSEFLDRRKLISALVVNPPSISPASLPSISPNSIIPKWLPPLHAINDPAIWRELWARGGLPTIATPAPDQVEPIDLSVKNNNNNQTTTTATTTTTMTTSSTTITTPTSDSSDHELCIDVGTDEPVKTVPLDLTLDRQTTDVTN